MIIEVKVPSPGESITEVQLATWLIKNGQQVEKDEDIVEIDSDKATLSLTAEAAGKIELLTQEGETIKVGTVVARIDTEAKGMAKPSLSIVEKLEKSNKTGTGTTVQMPKVAVIAGKVESKKDGDINLKVSPLARKLMTENKISENELVDFFKSVRIGRRDVEFYLENKEKIPVSTRTSFSVVLWPGGRNSKHQKMSMLRKKLSQRLVSVKNETAMLTTFNEVDMSWIMEFRKEYKDVFKERHGVGLGFMSFFVKAVTEAMIYFPQVNSQIDGDEIVTFDYVDISIAVSAPKGLVVPVIRNAELLGLADIEKHIKTLAVKARENKITLEDMQGGTFTITNGGVFGSMLSTPIINPPQSAILGMHNIVERPVAVHGKVEIRPIMYIALSYDHRVIDGSESVSFLVKVKEMLEQPERMLFGGKSPVENLLGL